MPDIFSVVGQAIVVSPEAVQNIEMGNTAVSGGSPRNYAIYNGPDVEIATWSNGHFEGTHHITRGSVILANDVAAPTPGQVASNLENSANVYVFRNSAVDGQEVETITQAQQRFARVTDTRVDLMSSGERAGLSGINEVPDDRRQLHFP